jgi:hypothetical protein
MAHLFWLDEEHLKRIGHMFPKRPGPDGATINIDSTHLKSTPDGGKPVKRGARQRAIGCPKGGLNSKLHTICDERGRPLNFFLSAGQMSNAKGALALLSTLPPAKMQLFLSSLPPSTR